MHRLTRRQKSEKELKNPPEEDPEFQIAPMIDILLVLLVFFMSISSTEVLQTTQGISLPVALDGKDAAKNAGQIILNITWVPIQETGSITISDVSYPDAPSITPVIQKAHDANPVIRVLIRADRNVKWEYMQTVMSAIAKGGVDNVTFSVVNQDSNTPLPPSH